MLERGSAATVPGPQRAELLDDPLAEQVAGPGEREGRVRVQALEAARAARAGDPAVEPGSLAVGEPAPDRALFLVRPLEARCELGVLARDARPALHAARRLDARERRHE